VDSKAIADLVRLNAKLGCVSGKDSRTIRELDASEYEAHTW